MLLEIVSPDIDNMGRSRFGLFVIFGVGVASAEVFILHARLLLL